MNNFSDLFKDVDVNAKYTPTQLQNFFLGIKSQLYDLNKLADSNTDSNFIKPQKIPTNIPQSLLQQDIIEEIENKSDPINKGNIKDTIKTALLANSRNVDQNVLNEFNSFTQLLEEERLPTELIEVLSNDYLRLVRGKSLLAIFTKNLTHHKNQAIFESVAIRPGNYIQKIFNDVEVNFQSLH